MEEKVTEDEDVFDLKSIMGFFNKNKRAIAISALVGFIFGIAFFIFIPAKFETSVPIYPSRTDPNTIQNPTVIVGAVNQLLTDSELFSMFLDGLVKHSLKSKELFLANPKTKEALLAQQTSFLNAPAFMLKSLKQGRGMRIVGTFPFKGIGKDFFDASVISLNDVIDEYNRIKLRSLEITNLEKLTGVKSKFREFKEDYISETREAIEKLNKYANTATILFNDAQKVLDDEKLTSEFSVLVSPRESNVSLGILNETTFRKDKIQRLISSTKFALISKGLETPNAVNLLNKLDDIDAKISLLNFDLQPIFGTMEQLQKNLINSSNDYYLPPEKTSTLLPRVILNEATANFLKETGNFDEHPIGLGTFSGLMALLGVFLYITVVFGLSIINSIK